jgi:outer membrane protein insertion porin family
MTFLVALLLVVTQAQAPAQPSPSSAAQFIGKPVVAAEVVVEGAPTTDAAIRDLIETRPGEALSMADVRETISHLFSLGRYQDIQVEAFDVPGGVRLRFNLEPIHSVQRIEFSGRLGLSEGTLRGAVTERFGPTPSVGRASEVAQHLQQIYNERGYLSAAIRPTVQVLHDPDRTIVTFEVTPGPVSRVGDVKLNGDPGVSRDAFLSRVHAEPGRVYERVEVMERLADWVSRQRKQDRYEATARHFYQPTDDGLTVNLTIELDRGPLVKVQFSGDPLPKDRLEDLVPVRREGAVDFDLIEDSERRIVSFLNAQGYWKATTTSTRQQTDDRLDVIFTVRRGLQYRVQGGVEVTGNQAISLPELRPYMPRLGDGDLFVEANLASAASAVKAVYLLRGFSQVKVVGTATELADGHVKPTIAITEGPMTHIGTVTFSGNKALSNAELLQRTRAKTGSAYYGPTVVQDREALLLEYRNRGFASATVEVTPTLSQDRSRADLTFTINEGPQTLVDHILVVGNIKTDPEVIRREIVLKEGGPLGMSDLIESRRKVAALGLFRRVQFTEITHSGSNNRDVLITVEEAPSTTMDYGGGVEASRRLQGEAETGDAREAFEFAPRGFFEIGRRNIGGRNRSVHLYTRLALRPDSKAAGAEDDGGLFGFEEYRIVGTYREPRSFGLKSDIVITGALEQGVRSSFNFARKGINADLLRTLAPGVRFNARYSFGTTKTFDVSFSDEGKTATIERIFPQVRLSAFSGAISRDTRDDVADPTRGMFVSGEGSIAARAIGGQVGFVKSYVQGLFFRRPGRGRLVLAGRVALGLADGFPREVQAKDDDGNPIPGEFITIEDIPASERFFAGGDTSIRGFALDTVGSASTITATGFPRGGNAVLLMNAEARIPLFGDMGAVVFIDGGNVFERASQLDLGDLRGAVGAGARYRSPIGPIRFDIGYKLDRRTIGTRLESAWAYHFSIGHAF